MSNNLSKAIGLYLGPVLFLIILLTPPVQGISENAWKVLAMALLMLCWWVTEAVPLPVSALLPMLLLPLLGIVNIQKASAPYADPIVFLFMGGFMVAVAMEKWNLHQRIALNIIRLTGTNANGIILGFFLATALISMWISNTATAIMMLPIGLSVIQLLFKSLSTRDAKGVRNFALCIMLAIAYGANIGGTATIIGTPPNVVFAGYIRETYHYEVPFARWFAVGLPFSLILLGLSYTVMVFLLFPNRLGKFDGVEHLIRDELKALGKMSVGERNTLLVFLATALLWIFRAPLVQLLSGIALSDTGIAILATLALFVIPVNFRKWEFVLDWRDTEKLPWGILLLFGGGLSLANALETTGIIQLIGDQFSGMQAWGFWLIIGLTAASLYLTEIMSNVALVTIFLPVVGGIAQGVGIDPLTVCITVTLAASCAFMLPMSTPPNAIVFASGHVKVSDMIKAGFWLNIISIFLIGLAAQFVIPYVFEGWQK